MVTTTTTTASATSAERREYTSLEKKLVPIKLIELTLLDLKNVIENDESGEEFSKILRSTLKVTARARDLVCIEGSSSNDYSCCCCCCPDWYDADWQPPLATLEEVTRLKQKYLRYVRVSDRYLHLSSLLLKSRAFHTVHQEKKEIFYKSIGRLPIVELPRTDKGKPYIPSTRTEEFNVSHHHPYVSIVRLLPEGTNLKVGVDLVSFEPLDINRYGNEMEFLKSFQTSFTEHEWTCILEAESSLLELHSRWAIKEAYTKALGLGMSLEFRTFETTLEDVSELWEFVTGGDDSVGAFVKGRVTRQDEEPTKTWGFYFLKLGTKQEELKGCCCICLGPLDDASDTLLDNEEPEEQLKIDWIPLSDLIEWHTNASL